MPRSKDEIISKLIKAIKMVHLLGNELVNQFSLIMAFLVVELKQKN